MILFKGGSVICHKLSSLGGDGMAVATVRGEPLAHSENSLFSELKPDVPEAARALFRRVCEFDFTREKLLAINRLGYDPETAAAMESEFRKYLFLRIMHPDQRLPMSKDVDDFWHMAVLNTRNYHRFCAEVAGGHFIHHGPTISEEENMALMPAYLTGTIARYTQYFGQPDSRFWPISRPDQSCCGC